MKRYSPDEILSYAKRQVEHVEKQRFGIISTGVLLLGIPAYMIYLLHEKSEALQVFLPLDKHFLLGIFFGVMFVMISLLGALALVSVCFPKSNGIEHHTLKRLIELEEEKSKNH